MHLLYIDPGAGSILIQSIIAGILGIAFVVKNYWFKIKGFFSKSPKQESEIDE